MIPREDILDAVAEHGPVSGIELQEEHLDVPDYDLGELFEELTELEKEDEIEYTGSGFETTKDPFELQVKADLEEMALSSDSADFETEYGSPSRPSLLDGMLPHFNIESYCTGGYQGTYVFRLDGPNYIWLLRDSYGSCSYCDGLIDNPNPYDYGLSMLRNAYAFEDEEDAIEFLQLVDNVRWERVKEGALGLFEDE